MLASNLDRKKYKNICLIESNSKIGQKIKVSGGAKCNITNEFVKSSNYLGDRDFAKYILDNFSKDYLLKFLNKNNLFPKINPKIVKGTYFCNSSQDVIDMFSLLTTHIKKFLDTKVLDIFHKDFFTILTNKGNIEAKKVVVASGGLSYTTLEHQVLLLILQKNLGTQFLDLNLHLLDLLYKKSSFGLKSFQVFHFL